MGRQSYLRTVYIPVRPLVAEFHADVVAGGRVSVDGFRRMKDTGATGCRQGLAVFPASQLISTLWKRLFQGNYVFHQHEQVLSQFSG